jgi:hypothetical protein
MGTLPDFVAWGETFAAVISLVRLVETDRFVAAIPKTQQYYTAEGHAPLAHFHPTPIGIWAQIAAAHLCKIAQFEANDIPVTHTLGDDASVLARPGRPI